jgi:predicted DNA-binding transcriptional regulator YafY
MPVPARHVDPDILKRCIATIRGGKSIEVLYQSMNPHRPEAAWRRISPHAFAYDGMRWHVRAFCHLDRRFKDFILSRCRQLRDEGEPGALAADDKPWVTSFDVILKPNPDLTDSQQATIAEDYGMKNGEAVFPVRRALLYYFEKRLRLDLDPTKDKPAEKPVIVANWDAFVKARDEARARA